MSSAIKSLLVERCARKRSEKYVVTNPLDAAAMKHMTLNFAKLDKFEGVNFIRWQKKMHFLLSSMSVVYVLTTSIPEDELWNSLEAKYMAEDASSKKFLVSNFTNYKMTDSRPVMEQYNELLGILGRFTQHKMNMDEAIQVSCIIDKLPPSWKDFKHTLKHKKEELTLVELGSHLRIEESLKVQDNDKPKGSNVAGPYYLCDLNAILSLGNKKYFVTFIDDASRFCYVYLLHSKDEALDKFKVFKTEVELQQGSQIKRFRTDRGGEYMDTLYFQSVGIIHETTAPYTPQQNGISKRKNKVLKEMVNSMAVVRLPDPKLKTLGERGIECIFVGYAEHSKAFRFYVIEPNDSVSINSIIESRDAIFDENRFSSVPRPSLRIPNGTEDIGGSVVPKEVTKEVVQQPKPELRKSKRNKTLKNFGPEFQLYLIEGTRDEKEAINDEMDSIMGNNTWVLADLPPGCKPLGCKWIFKRKLKVDGTIEKFKARLVIQGFKQKSGIDYFDTYAPVARISTIRLLIAMTSIHNLIIHQMDVKTAFLNGDLDEEVYMNQPQGFIMPGNENKVCKLIKSLYGLKQAPKQWHQKFDEVVLSNGYLLNQADKCVYSKFDETGKGVIICLYVDDMLIFGTNQVQVDLTKEFLSSRFFMKDMGEADVILRNTPMDTSEKLMPNNGQAVSQLEYSRVIGCLMYVMTCTRPDIAFVVGKLSRYTSNPGTQHWQAIQRVLKYLKKTMDYRLTYTGYPSVLKGYNDASWISNTGDKFFLGKGLPR
ncbi:zinc finger, CCHC-type containing protein [Tanacetum coccineum]